MARQCDMDHIGPGIKRQRKPVKCMAEPIVQESQRHGNDRCTQYRQTVVPKSGLVQNQLERLERHHSTGGNRCCFFSGHIADEMQGGMPVCRCVSDTARRPYPLICMRCQLPAGGFVRPERQKKPLGWDNRRFARVHGAILIVQGHYSTSIRISSKASSQPGART